MSYSFKYFEQCIFNVHLLGKTLHITCFTDCVNPILQNACCEPIHFFLSISRKLSENKNSLTKMANTCQYPSVQVRLCFHIFVHTGHICIGFKADTAEKLQKPAHRMRI